MDGLGFPLAIRGIFRWEVTHMCVGHRRPMVSIPPNYDPHPNLGARKMKRMTRLSAISALLGTLSLGALATDLQVGQWSMQPSGTARVGEDGIVGTPIDVEGDLGLGEEDVTVFDVHLGPMIQLGLQYMELNYTGDNEIGTTIQYQDLTFSPSTRVRSALDLQVAQAYLRTTTPDAPIRGGVDVGALYTRIESEVQAAGVGRASADTQAILPWGGLHLSIRPLTFLELGGYVRYSSFEISDVEVDYFEYELHASVRVGPAYAGVGMRQMDIEGVYDKEDTSADLSFDGPVVFIGLEF